MDTERLSRDHLENSRQLAWDCTCNAPGWPAALDHLLATLEASESRQRARRSADRERLRSTLGALVLGLYGAYSGDPGVWLAYSRNANDYGPSQRYVLPVATAQAASTAADFLQAAGLAEHRLGSYTRNAFGGGSGYRSRLRALPALIHLLQDTYGVTPESLGKAAWFELVRLKSSADAVRKTKQLVGYRDTPETLQMREELLAQNAFLAGFRIDLEGPVAGVDILDAFDQDEAANPAERSAIRLYRVFNNERWDHGGRFYGGWWQALPKSDRQRLLIDGEETVELDYRALHPRLCYHLEGQPLGPEDDPYTLPGLEGAGLRPIVKTAFNQLLNVRPGGTPRAPEGVRTAMPKRMSYKALLQRIEAAHAPIGHWFRAGRGVELQRIDSRMASTILGYLRFRGVCCLPVHDSFIVPRSAEFQLGQTMAMAYLGALSKRTTARSWPVISGWSSQEMEGRVMASMLD